MVLAICLLLQNDDYINTAHEMQKDDDLARVQCSEINDIGWIYKPN